MSCFIGISVQQQLNSQVYQLVLSEIEDFVSETNYQIIPHQHLLLIGSRYQKFVLPRNCDYLYTNLQHFLISENQDEQFVETVVESLMILKQNFPHQIQIEMVSDLQQIFNLKVKIDQQIPRRLISHLKILHEQSKKVGLTYEQVRMLIKNLMAQFHKDYKQKIKLLSLKILSQGKIDKKIWNNLTKQEIKIIDQIVNQPAYQKIGIEILQKIVRNNEDKVFSFSESKQNQSPNSNSFRHQLMQEQSLPEFEGPIDTMTALFQLKQSLNINRLSWIIENIDCNKLDAKKLNKFDNRIRQVAQKYLNGYYPDVSVMQLKNFGTSLTEYEMRRTNLSWGSLIQQILIKIEQLQRKSQKSRTKVKNSRKEIK